MISTQVPLEIMKTTAAEAYVTGASKTRVITLAGDDAPLYVAIVSVKTIERVAPALVRTQIQTAVAEDAPPPVPLGDDVCVVGERTFAAATRCPPGRAVLACVAACFYAVDATPHRSLGPQVSGSPRARRRRHPSIAAGRCV